MRMPKFANREMLRRFAKVWAAAKRYGRVVINSRDGDEFTMTAKVKAKSKQELAGQDFEAHYND